MFHAIYAEISMKFNKTIIAHKNKPINRIFSATTLKVRAKESPDVGASIGGHGFGRQRLEKKAAQRCQECREFLH